MRVKSDYELCIPFSVFTVFSVCTLNCVSSVYRPKCCRSKCHMTKDVVWQQCHHVTLWLKCLKMNTISATDIVLAQNDTVIFGTEHFAVSSITRFAGRQKVHMWKHVERLCHHWLDRHLATGCIFNNHLICWLFCKWTFPSLVRLYASLWPTSLLVLEKQLRTRKQHNHSHYFKPSLLMPESVTSHLWNAFINALFTTKGFESESKSNHLTQQETHPLPKWCRPPILNQ